MNEKKTENNELEEKEEINTNPCSGYEWDQEKQIHKCSTCSYHRCRNWLFSLEANYCESKEELKQFIRSQVEYARTFINKTNADAFYHQIIIKAIQKYTNIKTEKITEREPKLLKKLNKQHE